jgi:hypothetical protein
MDHMRYHKHRHDFNLKYFDHIVAEVFKKITNKFQFNQELTVVFEDNHFSNVECLDYKKLHQFLLTFFQSVTFKSENPHDCKLAPDFFTWLIISDRAAQQHEFMVVEFTKMPSTLTFDSIEKMFGLHILRPDLHRFGMLIELHRKNLLKHVDVRLGFDRRDLGMLEYRRTSNFDLACWEFDITHKELLELIDSLPQSDRRDFGDDGRHTVAVDLAAENYKKMELNKKFAIELICHSTFNDFINNIDEKFLRAVFLKQPFIYITSRDQYTILKNFGLQTFDNLWDESWDDLSAEFIAEKIKRIAETCDHIIKTYTIAEVFELTRGICQANSDFLLTRLCKQHGTESDRDMIRKVTADYWRSADRIFK